MASERQPGLLEGLRRSEQQDAVAIRVRLSRLWETMLTHQLAATDTPGELGTIAKDLTDVGSDASAVKSASMALAVIFIYIVLASQFGSFVQPIAIMASLPLALIGVMLALLFWRSTLNVFSMIGLVMLLGLIGALVMGARTQMNMADIMRWGFMPNSPHVVNTDVPEIEPWMTPFWKLTAIALLLVAVAHGIHGLVVVADDYIVSHRGRQIVRVISILLVLLFILTGAYVIWTA